MAQQDLIAVLRRAIKRDPRSLYAIAKDCGLRYSVVHRFATGERSGISLVTTAKLCRTLGLELWPVKRKARKGGACRSLPALAVMVVP